VTLRSASFYRLCSVCEASGPCGNCPEQTTCHDLIDAYEQGKADAIDERDNWGVSHDVAARCIETAVRENFEAGRAAGRAECAQLADEFADIERQRLDQYAHTPFRDVRERAEAAHNMARYIAQTIRETGK
jgi:hypothetical protein